jgi:PleD family two-component response regulator
MPETDVDRARDVATRLRRSVQQVGLSAKSPEPVEVSVGISAWRRDQDWQAVYQAADADLYEDKRRRKTVRRWRDEERLATVRLLGRSGGRRKVSGA